MIVKSLMFDLDRCVLHSDRVLDILRMSTCTVDMVS